MPQHHVLQRYGAALGLEVYQATPTDHANFNEFLVLQL
jgi:hypothetical protein